MHTKNFSLALKFHATRALKENFVITFIKRWRAKIILLFSGQGLSAKPSFIVFARLLNQPKTRAQARARLAYKQAEPKIIYLTSLFK